MDCTALIEQAIELAGSEAKLASGIGCSQPMVNKAKRTGRVSPEMAKAIHHFTGAVVPGNRLRPDIWVKPEDVPPLEPEAAS